jgi:hypothetical protein
MTVRRGGAPTPLDRVVAGLPARFLKATIEVDDQGNLTSLRDYMRDLADYLRAEGVDSGSVVDVMSRIGLPPSEWFRAALEAGAGSRVLGMQSNAEPGGAERLEADRAEDMPKPDLQVVK